MFKLLVHLVVRAVPPDAISSTSLCKNSSALKAWLSVGADTLRQVANLTLSSKRKDCKRKLRGFIKRFIAV